MHIRNEPSRESGGAADATFADKARSRLNSFSQTIGCLHERAHAENGGFRP